VECRLGSMKIMSSKHILVQPVVPVCGHMEEGISADELLPQNFKDRIWECRDTGSYKCRNTEKVNCHRKWWSLPMIT
jgi:hypothetical protein